VLQLSNTSITRM